MAGPDPRRSSRARTNQPQSRPSSTTSSVSGRIERAHKPFHKTGSPQKSASTASLASEPPDDFAVTDDTPPPPTRTRRAATNAIKDDDQDLSSVVVSEIEMLNDDDIQEDDEAVRCICGNEDYPGPPAPEDLKQASRDGYDIESIFPAVVTDDLAGFFVQCDICKVWQHGACVGLINDSTLPEEYYCEECRKDLHKIFSSTNGHRCSIYLALNRRRSRTESFTKDRDRSPRRRDLSKDSKDGTDGKEDGRESKSSRHSAASLASKRRSTMNSRDAAYDEEQLRIAIEASRGGNGDETDLILGRPKRSRSDSEEKADALKRQRTSSRSLSPAPDMSPAADDSDDAVATRNRSSQKASRNAAATRTQHHRERTEREEKERQRAEAANKRNGRAERRRADDSDPSDEVPLAARASSVTTRNTSAPSVALGTAPTTSSTVSNTTTTPTSAPLLSATPTSTAVPRSIPSRPSQPSPETPPPTSAPAMAISKSKGGRPTHKKKGRNQYTKERDLRDEQNSMTRSRSRDMPENLYSKSGANGAGHHSSKAGPRAKGSANSRVSLSEMRRRVSAMSDFISKTQIEIASSEYLGSESTPEGSAGAHGSKTANGHTTTNGSSTPTTPSSTAMPQPGANGDADSRAPQKDFKELPLMEMMDILTRNIIHWQNQFGN
ncbi:phd-finger domain-containing protein [Ophiostoma piceae UAMH 11346]|uniref:Phd-finger domain-containing protein n=1 Tax=Ophiostoma piceae (strain UAMH 11346) TaxID=1262450 RepID=S3D3S6_OPHP1|nr:phd-finger domain-containing protein [Ophiostoma piceae UAMH 11346]